MFRPELLAPAGDWAALRAALANGADAVYFGLQDFNARLRAANFTAEELPKVIACLHDHNVKGYVTLNTLVFSDELATAAERLQAIAEAGADAVIVQDLGLVPLIRRFLGPSLPIHASTQMTLTEARGITLVRSLGVQRVILARELSLAEIRQIAAATEAELEVFVHGALCISFSGQCLASLALGGRSANRGLCAQACRLPYRLLSDGKPVDLEDCRHPLSPQDLAAVSHIAELVGMGIRGFKIEGRLKDAHYVAATVRVYRAALDAAIAGEPFRLTRDMEEELAQGFSRGFTPGFLDGVDHQRLVVGRSPKGRGQRVGEVVGKTPRGIAVALAPQASVKRGAQLYNSAPLPAALAPEACAKRGAQLYNSATLVVALAPHARVKVGDGVVFDAPGAQEGEEEGGRVVSVEPLEGRTRQVMLAFRRGDVRPKTVPIGSIVWKTDDPEVRRRLEASYARDVVARPERITIRVRAAAGETLQVTFRDEAGHSATAAWERPLEPAEKHPLSVEVLRQQLGRLGGTPFELGVLEADRLDPVMVPKSVLNDLRRQAVEALRAQRRAAARHAVVEASALEALREGHKAMDRGTETSRPQPSLAVLVRSLEQLEAVLAWKPAMVYCDLPQAAEAVGRVRAAGVPVGLPTLRIIKPGEEQSLQRLAEAPPDAILVRNLAALAFFAEMKPRPTLVGDFSLNVANDLAADLLLSLGLDRVTPSLDLGGEQLEAMLRRVPPDRCEVVLHQHVAMFHTQHCLFAARLARGRGRGDCGSPCRRRAELLDRIGEAHPVLADAACRNTIYQSRERSCAVGAERLRRLGVRHFRIEFLRETPQQTHALLDRCGALLGMAPGHGEAFVPP